MCNEVAIRREFLESAKRLVHQRPSPENIADVIEKLTGAINTMTTEPMRAVLLVESEIAKVEQVTGVKL